MWITEPSVFRSFLTSTPFGYAQSHHDGVMTYYFPGAKGRSVVLEMCRTVCGLGGRFSGLFTQRKDTGREVESLKSGLT